MEMGIPVNDDHLNDDQRSVKHMTKPIKKRRAKAIQCLHLYVSPRYHYYHHMLHEHFVPLDESLGGCGGSYDMACATVLQTLWHHASDRYNCIVLNQNTIISSVEFCRG